MLEEDVILICRFQAGCLRWNCSALASAYLATSYLDAYLIGRLTIR